MCKSGTSLFTLRRFVYTKSIMQLWDRLTGPDGVFMTVIDVTNMEFTSDKIWDFICCKSYVYAMASVID